MAALATSQQFAATTLLTADATADNILSALRAAAASLHSGDIFFLTFSGHGGSVPDRNGDESDGRDETWVAYDRQLLDDELYHELTAFPEGVRVFAASDSCHSGTVLRRRLPDSDPLSLDIRRTLPKAKAMPLALAATDGERRAKLYEGIQASVPPSAESQGRLAACVLLISGCSDSQFSYVGPKHSVYTGMFLRSWAKGKFDGTYEDFYQAILAKMPSNQTPQWSVPGPDDADFFRQRPFTI
jgi:hypothetical protein